jgi:pimeloyl-ACP methyl ester carboxylesterase
VKTERSFIPGDGCSVPAILLIPEHPRGAAIIVHGYGGNKEEQLGLGWRVAEAGLLACVIDLRGHGEHPLQLDINAGSDLNAAIRYCRSFGKVTAIGHSLGGRLALLSDADFRIAISPSLGRMYGERTQEMLRTLRSHRVRPPDLATLLAIQERLLVWDPASGSGNTLLLFAERDAPEIREGCITLMNAGVHAIEIPGAMHSDIFLVEQTFSAIRDQIGEWYGTGT